MSTRRTVLAGGGAGAVLCLTLLLVVSAAWAAAGWTAQSSGTASALGAVALHGPARRLGRGRRRHDPATTDGGATWTAPEHPRAHHARPRRRGLRRRQPRLGRGRRRHDPAHQRRRRHLDAPSTPVPTTHDLAGVAFADASDGWAVGAAGTILTPATAAPPGPRRARRAHHARPRRRGLRRRQPTAGPWAPPARSSRPPTAAPPGPRRAPPCPPRTTSPAWPSPTPATAGPWAPPARSSRPATAAPPGRRRAPPAHHARPRRRGLRRRQPTAGPWAPPARSSRTTDGGATWTAQTSPARHADLAGVAFADAKHGWVVGAGGTVLETLSAGVPDATAPVTRATGLQADGHSGWRNTAADGHPQGRRRGLRRGRHLRRRRRRPAADLHRSVRARGRRFARGLLLVGRSRRQHRGDATRAT